MIYIIFNVSRDLTLTTLLLQESIMSEASEYNDVVTETLRRRNSKLKDKIRRLEEVLSKCKSTIQNGIDATNSLSKEKVS